MKKMTLITCLLALIVAASATAVENNWRLIITTGSSDDLGVTPPVHYGTAATDFSLTAAPGADPSRTSVWNVGVTDPWNGVIYSRLWKANHPSQYVFDIRVAALPLSEFSAIKLRVDTLNDAILPPGDGWVYKLVMVDNKGVAGAPANGTEWNIPVPTSHPTNLLTIQLPMLKVSAVTAEAFQNEGYKMQLVAWFGKVATPQLIPAGGMYAQPIQVAMTCATSGAAIRYTTDGTSPIESSLLYTGPVLVDRSMTLKARAFKSGWSASSIASADYVIIGSLPTGWIKINYEGGIEGEYTNQQSVALTLYGIDQSGSPAVSMRLRNDTDAWGSWETYATSKPWSLSVGDGAKTVYVQYQDALGGISEPLGDSITLDTTAPTGSVTINDGDASTDEPDVTLTLAATDEGSGVADMRVTNDAATWGQWEPFGSSKAWTLEPGEGTKTVYVQFRDGAGNVSTVYEDSIEVMGSVHTPIVVITSPTTEPTYATNKQSVIVSGTASGGIDEVVWSTDRGDLGVCSGTTQWTTGPIDLAAGETEITITATNVEYESASSSLVVTYVDTSHITWKGFAMVSLPVIPEEIDPQEVIGFSQNGWFMYHAQYRRYIGYGNDPERLTWFIPPEDTPGRGFWARFANEVTVPVGTIPEQSQPVVIGLRRGWNIIGNPFLSAVPWDLSRMMVRTAGAADIPLLYASDKVSQYAWGWVQDDADPFRGAYELVCDPGAMQLFIPGTTDSLQPWRAYWIVAFMDCYLVILPP